MCAQWHVHPATVAPSDMCTQRHVRPVTCAPSDMCAQRHVHPATCSPSKLCAQRNVRPAICAPNDMCAQRYVHQATCVHGKDSDQHARAVWSGSSQGTLWVAKDLKHLQGDSEDSNQPAQMRRLICLRWVHMLFCRKCCFLSQKQVLFWNFARRLLYLRAVFVG